MALKKRKEKKGLFVWGESGFQKLNQVSKCHSKLVNSFHLFSGLAYMPQSGICSTL